MAETNGRHFADDIFKRIFLNENVRISIKISLKFVPEGPINNIPALVQIMAWRRSGYKPLSEPMMVSLPTHTCVTRPQWVKVHMMKLAVVTFKSYHGFSIESIKELFTEVQSVHDRDTRQSRKYYVLFTRKEIVRISFKCRAARLWNHLFDNVDINCSVACFRHYVKSYLTNNGGLDMLDSCLL